MQKFTRALTREVEIHGERYAVTLSEQGVSLRPVGSRKPPHETTWDQIAQWMGVGAAESSHAPSAVTVANSSRENGENGENRELVGLLDELDAWLESHRPGFHEGLARGATARDLEKLATVLGGPVPEDLQTWLRWHNGQGDGEMGSLVGAFNLLSAAEIAEILREHKENPGDTPWGMGWIPLLDDFQGDTVCLDSMHKGLPVLEIWSGNDAPTPAAPSLTAWVRQFLADCRAGNYVEDPERGEFLKRS
jgi:cell wall assembly regulator SMI1